MRYAAGCHGSAGGGAGGFGGRGFGFGAIAVLLFKGNRGNFRS
jgi:hypothetical protein